MYEVYHAVCPLYQALELSPCTHSSYLNCLLESRKSVILRRALRQKDASAGLLISWHLGAKSKQYYSRRNVNKRMGQNYSVISLTLFRRNGKRWWRTKLSRIKELKSRTIKNPRRKRGKRLKRIKFPFYYIIYPRLFFCDIL